MNGRMIVVKECQNNQIFSRRGMTLVEMMVSLSIFGVIMAVVFGFMTSTSRSYERTREKVHYQQSVRAVVSLLTREIRSTGCDPGNAGFDAFFTADGNVLRCRADLNGDADITDLNPDEDITYTFDAGTGELSRDNGTDDLVILRGLTNLQFTYLDSNGDALGALPLSASDRDLIRFVQISIVGETEDGEPIDYQTRVLVRNG